MRLDVKPKPVLFLALVLSGGLFGCSSAREHLAALSNVVGADTHVSEIHMVDTRNGWAWSGGIEHSNLLLHTSDGGRTWQDRTPRAFPYGDRGSCFLDSQTAWVPTFEQKNGGGLLRTTDGGKSWSVLINQGALHYGYISEAEQCRFFNTNDGLANTADYAAGSAYVCYYETHNGGKNWQPVVIIPPSGIPDLNAPPGTIHLSDITPETIGYCPPANVVITHGDLDDEQPKDGVRLSISTNLGRTWRNVKLPLPSEKYREGLVACSTPVFLDAKNGWLPVHIFKYGGRYTFAWDVMAFAVTHDGGKTWTSTPTAIECTTNSPARQEQFDIVSARDIFVWNGANLSVTHDAAKSWQTVKPNIIFARTSAHGEVSQIDFVDARHGWAVIYDNFPQARFYFYKTSDGGATWTELPFKILH
jgi:photosystem II stability/assembly factor-like uncharacterized protein